MSVVSPELGEFLKEARRVTSEHRVCVVTLFVSDGTVVEFGDADDRSSDRSGDRSGNGPGNGSGNGLDDFDTEWPVPDLLLEIPHGATREVDYQSLRSRLSPELPEDLVDYFFVNTDVGSSELAYRVAKDVVRNEAPPALRSVLVVRCLVPRTFIDTNRVVDRSTLAESEGEDLSHAFADYIRSTEDRELLLALYERYHQIAARAHALVCGSGGLSIAPHTYAPKSIGIDSFDEGIGKALRRAYEPDLYKTWKTRPEVDFITQGIEITNGEQEPELPDKLAPMSLVDAVRSRYADMGVQCAENESYPLHPASMAHHYSALHPGQVLCFEIRRDLLADPFSPFEEMKISPEKVARMADPITQSVVEFLAKK